MNRTVHSGHQGTRSTTAINQTHLHSLHLIVGLTGTTSGLITEHVADVAILALSAASMSAESPAYYAIYLLPTKQASAPVLLADETGYPLCPTTPNCASNPPLPIRMIELPKWLLREFARWDTGVILRRVRVSGRYEEDCCWTRCRSLSCVEYLQHEEFS